MQAMAQPSPPPQPSSQWVHVMGNPVPSTGATPATPVATPHARDVGDSRDSMTGSPPAKRRREDRERSRVSRACDRCKKKKTRCTGRCPCTLCLKVGLSCEFTASYTRGRLPSVPVDEAVITPNTHPRITLPGISTISEASPVSSTSPSFHLPRPVATPRMEPPPPSNNIFAREDHLTVPNGSGTRSPPSRTSPEPLQTDQQGHYLGSASAVSFLLRIQKRLHQHQNNSVSHDSSIFTFGDAALPESDPSFFVLPPKADAQRLVERYFDFAAPTHRFLHRPTIEKLLDEFYETQGELRNKEEAPAKMAVLLIVFAQGQAYMPEGNPDHEKSARYYFASEHQLSKERGAVRLASVQARLGQCFYLLTQSRINHCWSLFGTMAHLAFAIGLNRGRRCDTSATVDYIDLESRRRLFWVAYTLDKYLAAALGRPRTFKDEDIDQELPAVVNDSDLHSNRIETSTSSPYGVALMMAPVEHIKLSQILSRVLRDLYPIRPPTLPARLSLSEKYTSDLHSWRSALTRFLDTSELPSSLLIPIYQRQRNVLNLAYYHAMLLVHRPFLLSNFAALKNYGTPNTSKDAGLQIGAGSGSGEARDLNVDVRDNIQQCLDAAMGIVRVVDEMNSTQFFRAFWFTQYYAFCAVVVLYVYRIQQGIVSPGKCEGYFKAGQRCQAVLSSISETDCLSKRYCLVLEELRLEAARHQHRPGSGSAGTGAVGGTTDTPEHAQSSTSSSSSTAANANLTAPALTPQSEASPAFSNPYYPPTTNNPLTPDSALFNTSFLPTSNIMADLTSWGQFDSLVTAGIGMLDGGGFMEDGGWGFGFGL
ncbi:hypothetical protein K458DRAFT_178271 [Lentithecium fluviatile CBS 122367]|uniref:Zn(2)-C6 fungal-type domain-containing protein n=1 Tax=Lentithecium fluviatile CBS 122367 TaxID=1168545 RepID=A0A6G1IFS2_9PLEO|nr:hypothetical protein K458DRAFT_178271 [Lentithecium fluviatile CBS 122367]